MKFDIDAANKRVTITMNSLKFVDEGKYKLSLLKDDGTANDDGNFHIYVKGLYDVIPKYLLSYPDFL